MERPVLFEGEALILRRFWANNEPCLWITDPRQRSMPKMEFVGGYPNEYCIFLRDLSREELARITLPDGSPLDLAKELEG